MPTIKTINNNFTNTNYIIQSFAEMESQQPSTATPVAQQQQEAAPKTTTTKTIKTPKKAAKATISTSFKSFTTQHGYFVPSTLKNNITHTTYTTSLTIALSNSSVLHGYTLTCKVNGEQQTSVVGDADYSDWKLKLQAGDRVEVEVLGGQSTQTITYTINENGVSADATEGVKHAIKGTHKADLDIQDKYRKESQQEETVAAPAQETPAPVATQEVSTPAQEETAVEESPVATQTTPAPAQPEQVLTFGKYAGKSLSSLDSSYLKWLVSHESRLAQGNRWACTAARGILAARQAQEEQKAA